MPFWERLKEQALRYYLLWRSDPRRISSFLSRLEYPETLPRTRIGTRGVFPGGDEVSSNLRVAAVQMRVELVGSAEAYAEKIYRLVRQAVSGGAQLVAFPEDTATGLIGLLPGLEKLAGAGSLEGAVKEMAGDQVQVADVFRFLGPATRRIHEATFSNLARLFGVYLVSGSALLPRDDGQVVNVAHFYGPDGRLLGSQEKCHFIPLEWEWGLQPGNELRVFSTPWTKVATPICMDASFFETFRLASLQGAEVVVIPTANPEEYNFWKALRGIWPRVQESCVYGINPCLVGELMGIKLTGRAGIFAPLALSPAGDGILAQAASFKEETVVLADLDLKALRRLRQEEGWVEGFNRTLYEKYFPQIYDFIPGPPPGNRR